MANLSTLFSGGRIKAIYRGTISIANGNGSATATITGVNTSKSLVFCLGASGYYDISVRVELTNSTTVTAFSDSAAATTITVGYQVVEYA